MEWDEVGEHLKKLHGALASQHDSFEPLAFGGPDELLWSDCDLASLAENRLGDTTDPRGLDEARRADWLARATSGPPLPPSRRLKYERPYWLRDAGRRIGTIAVSTSALGSPSAGIASFYIFSDERSRGVGSRVLGRMQTMFHAHGLGLRLETSWCWPRAVRFYLRAGLWLRMWKHDLQFCIYPGDPKPIIELGDTRATISVDRPNGERVVLETATREGDKLISPDKPATKLEDLGEAPWHAMPTLALAVAAAGWPLIRSRKDWDASYYADSGPPEALAYKITLWEAWDRDHGWQVDAPRIPGLEYPTWAELEARRASE